LVSAHVEKICPFLLKGLKSRVGDCGRMGGVKLGSPSSHLTSCTTVHIYISTSVLYSTVNNTYAMVTAKLLSPQPSGKAVVGARSKLDNAVPAVPS
jgi:hypothetical protein